MDYKTAHLSWLKNNPQFIPQGYAQFAEYPYFDIMTQLYSSSRVSQVHAQMLFIGDQEWYNKCSEIKKSVAKVVKTIPSAYFITIGFNHQTWNVQSAIDVINKIKSFDWVISFKGVIELHTENGEHPHIHMLIDTELPKSKVLEKIWATKGIKKLVLKKNFIDIKKAEVYHDEYIVGDKDPGKKIYVDQDKIWRAQLSIPDVITK